MRVHKVLKTTQSSKILYNYVLLDYTFIMVFVTSHCTLLSVIQPDTKAEVIQMYILRRVGYLVSMLYLRLTKSNPDKCRNNFSYMRSQNDPPFAPKNVPLLLVFSQPRTQTQQSMQFYKQLSLNPSNLIQG